MKDVIVITGGTSGLGLEMVKQSIERGLFVCNIARNVKKMEELDKKYTDNYKGFVGDITDADFVAKSVQEIAKLGNIKYLVNCAEKAVFKAPTKYENNDIDVSLAGLKGMILCSTEALKAKNEENLKIINIMSSAALKGNKGEALYCSAKWGERGYTESLKAAYKGTTVKVIGVYPGGMNTEFWNESRDYVSEEKSNSFMNPADVAKTILENVFTTSNLTVSDIVIERN